MKNSFSFDRFWLYAKAELMSSRRLMLLLLGCMEGLFMLIYYLNHISESGTYVQGVPFHETTTPVMFVWLSIAIISMFNISMSFRNYFHKGYANATIMQPVAQSEKFTFSLIVNSFVVPIALILLGALTNWIWTSGYGIDFNFIVTSPDDFWRCMLIYSLIGLFSLSIYFLGAVLLRRYQFIFTIIAVNIIGISLFLLGYWTNQLFPNFFVTIIDSLSYCSNEMIQIFGRDTVMDLVYWGSVLCLITATGIVWLIAWKRFRKLQITK